MRFQSLEDVTKMVVAIVMMAKMMSNVIIWCLTGIHLQPTSALKISKMLFISCHSDYTVFLCSRHMFFQVLVIICGDVHLTDGCRIQIFVLQSLEDLVVRREQLSCVRAFAY
jgi:hypothetical protein